MPVPARDGNVASGGHYITAGQLRDCRVAGQSILQRATCDLSLGEKLNLGGDDVDSWSEEMRCTCLRRAVAEPLQRLHHQQPGEYSNLARSAL